MSAASLVALRSACVRCAFVILAAACTKPLPDQDAGDGACACALQQSCVSGMCVTAELRGLSMGDAHACVALDDGGLVCWGSNEHGQIDRRRPEIALPARVTGIHGVQQVIAGPGGTCVIDTVGALTCWGQNPAGRFGTAGEGERIVLEPDRVRAVAVGAEHICYTRDGRLLCRGAGYASAGAPPTLILIPSDGVIEGLTATQSPVAPVTCAWSEGKVYCFGSIDGPLGRVNMEMTAPPLEVPGLIDVIQVVAGESAVCTLDAGHHVWCWGRNHDGVLGVDEVTVQEAVLPRQVSLGSNELDMLALRGRHVVAAELSNDRILPFGWGRNQNYQLSSTLLMRRPGVLEDPQLADVGWVAASTGASCYAWRRAGGGGEVRCAGRSSAGELGVLDVTDRPAFAVVPPFDDP